MYIIILLLLVLCGSLSAQPTGTIEWKQTQGPTGGYVEDFAFRGNRIYLSGIRGAHYRDAGADTWTQILRIFGGTQLCVTHKGTIIVDAGSGRVYVSTDHGGTWSIVNVDGNIYNADEILVAKNDYVYTSNQVGIYRSTDQGSSWVKIARDGLMALDSANTLYITTDSGLVSSTNNGTTWKLLSNSIKQFNSTNSMVVNKSGNIFLAYSRGFARSTDKGKTWKSDSIGIGHFNNLSVNSQGHVFAQGVRGVYRTTNNGTSWSKLRGGPDSIDYTSLACSPQDELFLGTLASGVSRSTDNGTSWHEYNPGLVATIIYSIFGNGDTLLYACAGRRGLFRATEFDWRWEKVPTSPTYMDVCAGVITSENRIFIANDSGGIYRSDNLGKTWQLVKASKPTSNRLPSDRLFVDRADYIYTSVLAPPYRSTDHGATWDSLRLGRNSTIHSLAYDSDGSLWLGDAAGLFKSSNGGTTWEEFPHSIYSVKFVIDSNGYFFIVTETEGVARSTDNGLSWHSMWDTVELAYPSLTMNQSGYLFAGAYFGVYRSVDTGNTWHRTTHAIDSPAFNYFNMMYVNDREYVFGASNGAGVFRTVRTTSDVEHKPTDLPDLHVAPNPSSGMITISTTLMKEGQLSVTIYDINGVKLEERSEHRPAGIATMEFDLSDVPSGLYIYRIQTTSGVVIEKSLIQR